MPRCTRILTFDAAHRVLRHESKCSTLHGHTYKVELTAEADQLDGVGRVVDFGVIKARVGAWIDEHLDHTTICNAEDVALLAWCKHEHVQLGKRKPYALPGEPTAENLAEHLLLIANVLIRADGVRVVHVRVWETANCFADADATDKVRADEEVRAGRSVQDPAGRGDQRGAECGVRALRGVQPLDRPGGNSG